MSRRSIKSIRINSIIVVVVVVAIIHVISDGDIIGRNRVTGRVGIALSKDNSITIRRRRRGCGVSRIIIS